MNESSTQTTTEFVLRRLEEPFSLFGKQLPSFTWWIVLGVVLAIGFLYVGWMYLRDSRGIGGWWAALLGLFRSFVYILLAAVFLMPAEQTWYETKQRSRVVCMIDVSLSMSTIRDDMPPAGKTHDQMPTRMDKVLSFLNDP